MVRTIGDEGGAVRIDRDADRIEELGRATGAILMPWRAVPGERAYVAGHADGAEAMVC